MTDRVHKTRLIALLLAGLAAVIAGCATGPLPGVDPEQRAERLARSGDHAASAGEYIGLASRAAGQNRDRLTLLAIEQWLEAGDGRRARNALRQVPEPAGGELGWLWNMNAAALALWEGRPDGALERLEPLLGQPLPRRQRLRAEALQADAWFQRGDPIRAVELYRQRGRDLASAEDRRRNLELLWAGIKVTPPQALRQAAASATDRETGAWLSLGALAASTGQQGIGWANGVRRWLDEHPAHPAASLLGELELPAGDALGYPRQLALLLPLSGDNAAAGDAVRHGFFGAYFAAAGALDVPQEVRIYDTAAPGTDAYGTAVADGAEFVVGPLLRPRVSGLAGGALLPVPVLALNYLPDGMAAPPAMFQFALSPEDEAVAAAERALADGHRHALALVPRNDWGRRLANAFAQAFEAGGGTLLEARDYEPAKQDFSFEIENLLLLSQSVQRYQRLRANIGGPLQFDPRRRQDADFIFLAATAPTGRLLKSQLKFHYAGDLPVYSTSRIYAIDGRSNADLNGVMFADTPWVVDPQPWIEPLGELYAEAWPAQRQLGRLYALGYDAYQLVAALHGANVETELGIDGATGELWLDEQGRIHRRLAFARFEGGEAVPLPPPGGDLPHAEELEPAETEDDDAGFDREILLD